MWYITYNKNMFEVLFYEKEDGTKPAEEYILSEDIKLRAKMTREILLLEEFGNLLREPHSKPLEDGIFELRARVGTDISRVLYFFVIGKKIILTNGFRKKTEKTPQDVIDISKKYRDDYIKRYGEGENKVWKILEKH